MNEVLFPNWALETVHEKSEIEKASDRILGVVPALGAMDMLPWRVVSTLERGPFAMNTVFTESSN